MSVLVARGAGVRKGRRWLFRDLDVTVEPGELVAIAGPPGSGRTTVLLALVRRFRLSAGRVAISGTASLAHVPDVETPEPVFTVAEHIRERLALLGRPRSQAASVDLRGLDPQKKGHDLSPYEKQLLGLILARLSAPSVIALDGLDEGMNAAEREALWTELEEVTAGGVAVLFTARETDRSSATTVICLGVDPAEATSNDAASSVAGAEEDDGESARQGSADADGGGAGDGDGVGR
jgi:ABC-2 type transport system ATP-binding protein